MDKEDSKELFARFDLLQQYLEHLGDRVDYLIASERLTQRNPPPRPVSFESRKAKIMAALMD